MQNFPLYTLMSSKRSLWNGKSSRFNILRTIQTETSERFLHIKILLFLFICSLNLYIVELLGSYLLWQDRHRSRHHPQQWDAQSSRNPLLMNHTLEMGTKRIQSELSMTQFSKMFCHCHLHQFKKKKKKLQKTTFTKLEMMHILYLLLLAQI